MTMFGSTVGSGILSLPYAFQISGWPLGAAALFWGVGLNVFTCYLLIRVMEEHNTPMLDMLTHHVFQSDSSLLKTLIGIAAQVTIILFNYGSLISYFIVVRDIQVENSLVSASGEEDWKKDEARLLWGLLCVALTFPLCLANSLGSLRYSGILGFVIPIYMALFLIAEPEFSHYHCNATPHLGGLAFGIPVILFATTCQPNVGDVYQDLNRKEKNGFLVILAMLGTVLVLYFIVGLFGCLHFHHVNINFLNDGGFPKDAAGISVTFI